MSNEHKKIQKPFPKYRLIVDDTGVGNKKYHVGYLTGIISDEQLEKLEAQFVKSHDKCLKNINEVIACTNKVLDQLSEAMDLKNEQINQVEEVHANEILTHISGYEKKFEKVEFQPVQNEKIATIINNSKDFQVLLELASKIDPTITRDTLFSDSNEKAFNKFLSVSKKLVACSFFEYAEHLSDILGEQNLQIIASRPTADIKLAMENSQLIMPRKNDNKQGEYFSFVDLVTKTLNLIQETDKSNQIHVQVLCDNGIRKNTTNLILHNHKEFNPFSIRKVTADFMESNGHALIESADALAWLNNRFESVLIQKITKKEENLKYVDEKVFDLFANKLMKHFADSSYERLSMLLQAAGVPVKTSDRTDKQFVTRVIESVKEQ